MSATKIITGAEHWTLLRRCSEAALHDAVRRNIDALMARHQHTGEHLVG